MQKLSHKRISIFLLLTAKSNISGNWGHPEKNFGAHFKHIDLPYFDETEALSFWWGQPQVDPKLTLNFFLSPKLTLLDP